MSLSSKQKSLAVRNVRTAEDYDIRDQRTHIYLAPDTFIGNAEHKLRVVYAVSDGLMKQIEVSNPEGMYHLLYEILSNAVDNADSSMRMGVNPGAIYLEVDSEWITVTNQGEPIPIKPHHKKLDVLHRCVTVPEVVFGTLLASNNYDSKSVRLGIGRNGYGAKLANIFSLAFVVEVGDPKNGQHFHGEWSYNMTQTPPEERVEGQEDREPTIVLTPGYQLNSQGEWTPVKGERYTGEAYVSVSWRLDFNRFDMESYSQDDVDIFRRMLMEFCWTCRVPTVFTIRGQESEQYLFGIKDYASMLWNEETIKSGIVHRQWCEVGTVEKTKKGVKVQEVVVKTIAPPTTLSKLTGDKLEKRLMSPKTADEIPMVELFVVFTPHEGRVFSFVNGMPAREGPHIDTTYTQLSAPFLTKINKRNKEKNKESENDKDAIKLPTLTVLDFKKHVSFILSVRTPETKYSTQDKRELVSVLTPVEIDPKVIERMEKWDIEKLLKEDLHYKNDKATHAKKRVGRINSTKLRDANFATEHKHPELCVLYIVEGASASQYVEKRVNYSDGNLDKNGILQLKGKPLNISDVEFDDLVANVEFKLIMDAIGLERGVDYSQEANFRTLRYHNVVIATDADSDGSHIRLLVLNMFHVMWPALLQRGMLSYLMTPAVRLYTEGSNPQCVGRFYSEKDYEDWMRREKIDLAKEKVFVKFYKGLGTNENAEAKDDMCNANVIVCIVDEQAGESLDLAFNPKKTDQRKEWIQHWSTIEKKDEFMTVSVEEARQLATYHAVKKYVDACEAPIPLFKRAISSSVNQDLHNYAVDNLFRAIPCWMDGLKKSQRQIVYYFLKKWNYGRSDKKADKVATAVGEVMSTLHYHHGDKSLEKAIIVMGQDFLGSNNLNVLKPEGQFGSREDGPSKTCAGRYLSTKPMDWVEFAFNKEMVEMIEKRKVDNTEVEPYWIPCDVPLGVINGFSGIATGWASNSPSHHPIHVIEWLIARCKYSLLARKGEGEVPSFPELRPFFRGFKGITKQVQDDKPSIQTVMNDDGETVEIEIPVGRKTVTEGTFKSKKVNKSEWNVEIIELPVGMWNSKYENWLKELMDTKLEEEETGPAAAAPAKKKPKKETILTAFTQKRDEFTNPTFSLTGLKFEPTVESLRLRSTFSLEGIVMIDEHGTPQRYNSIVDVIEIYWRNMFETYSNYHRLKISQITKEIEEVSLLRKLIYLLAEGIVVTSKRTDEDIIAQLEPHGIPIDYVDKVNFRQVSDDKLKKLDAKIKNLEDKKAEIESTEPENMWVERLEKLSNFLRRTIYRDIA